MVIDIKKILEEKAVIIDKSIEKYIPREFDEKSINFIWGPATYKYNIKAPTKFLSEPLWNLLDRGGKRWRPVLFLFLTEALGADSEKYLDLVIFPELIHNGSLIIDDIEDGSEERRGKPTIHKIFDIDISINAGNLLYYLGLLPILRDKDKFDEKTRIRLYDIYIEEMLKIGLGQGIDIVWHKGMADADDITEEEYFEMTANKTGCIARLAGKIAAIIGGRSEEEIAKIGKFTESIGIAFQIQDDILNISGKKFAERKGGLGEDITEGKRSLLVIHTLRIANKEDRKRLLEILSMNTVNQKFRDEAIEIMKKYDSIEYSKKKAKEIVKESWEKVEKILPKSEAKEKLKSFAYYLIDRDI